MSRATGLRLGILAALAALTLLAACASTPPADGTRDYGMVAGTRATHGEAPPPAPAPEPEPPATSAPSVESLVSFPVPPEPPGPQAELGNIFDRIRLGYRLPDVADRSVAS
ncbi:MAG: hypothetical protein JSR54_15955, partial [Proteobacteria bacterium]|nr:hypothetical protein [Pseudomonadota bacterium]